ncbi:hypothetical protein BJX76DRAFT_134767 [Aspergillus varians]
MLAAIEPMQQVPNPSHYPWTPTRPSPLSPRRQSSSTTTFATTPTHQPQFQSPTSIFAFTPSPSPSQNKTEPTTASSRSRSPNFNTNANANVNATSPTPTQTYATRYTTTISNPLLAHSIKRAYASSTSPRARSVRRNAFLNRVKQDRESGRFEARAERLAYLEDIAEHKELVEAMRRRADEIQSMFGPGIEDEDGEGEYLDTADEAEIQALDEYLEQEHAMEMELLAQMESAGYQTPTAIEPRQGDPVSSFSDEEYDDIFMDMMDHSPPEDMDMSG